MILKEACAYAFPRHWKQKSSNLHTYQSIIALCISWYSNLKATIYILLGSIFGSNAYDEDDDEGDEDPDAYIADLISSINSQTTLIDIYI